LRGQKSDRQLRLTVRGQIVLPGLSEVRLMMLTTSRSQHHKSDSEAI